MVFIGLFGGLELVLGFRLGLGVGHLVLIEMSDVVIVPRRELETGDNDSCADLRACASMSLRRSRCNNSPVCQISSLPALAAVLH